MDKYGEDAEMDLVFHGGSGTSPQDLQETLDYGVIKMNIDTDTQFAFAKAVGSYVESNARAFKHQIDPDNGKPYKKVYDPRKLMRDGETSMADRLQEAFQDLGAVGKSAAL